jgi:hypothetical protein
MALTQVQVGLGGNSNAPAFSAVGTSISVATATPTKLTATTVRFDTNSNYATSRFTPTVAGYYQINATASSGTSATGYVGVSIYKNGSAILNGTIVTNSSVGPTVTTSTIVSMNGTTDYVEIYGTQTSGGSLTMGVPDFSGCLVRAT